MSVSRWCIRSSSVVVRLVRFKQTELDEHRHTYLDLCGWLRFPGSSKVQGDVADIHAWQGWPSSHFMRRRLDVFKSDWKTGMRVYMHTDSGRKPCIASSVRAVFTSERAHLLSLNRRSLSTDAVCESDGMSVVLLVVIAGIASSECSQRRTSSPQRSNPVLVVVARDE